MTCDTLPSFSETPVVPPKLDVRQLGAHCANPKRISPAPRQTTCPEKSTWFALIRRWPPLSPHRKPEKLSVNRPLSKLLLDSPTQKLRFPNIISIEAPRSGRCATVGRARSPQGDPR